jgi:hypothetical protein
MKLLFGLSRTLAILAGLWAIVIAIYLLVFATATSVSVEAGGTPDQAPVTTQTVEQVPFVVFAGPAALIALLLFSSLLILGGIFAWRKSLVPAGMIAILALVATYLTGFSIGGFYFPGAVFLCLSVLAASAAARVGQFRKEA